MTDVLSSETCNCGVGGPIGEKHHPDCVRYVARASKEIYYSDDGAVQCSHCEGIFMPRIDASDPELPAIQCDGCGRTVIGIDRADVVRSWNLANGGASGETCDVVVAGDSISTSLAMFQHKCSVHIADEQVKPNPNNALIDTLCEAIRLCRENEKLARAPLPVASMKAFSATEVKP